MDQGLFAKHIRHVLERGTKKEELISLIKEKTGVILLTSEISLDKKNVSIATSSVKKAILFRKGLQEILQHDGFNLVP